MRSPPKKEQPVHLTVRKTAEWEARVKHGTMENQCDDEEWEFIIPIIKAPTMNECEEARGLRSFAFQKDSNYSKNLLERSV